MTNQLYVFAVSHYCEKAQWALAHHGITHELCFLAPGLHFHLAKDHSLIETSVPILIHDKGVVQGSANIMDWAELQSDPQNSIAANGASEIEQRVDDILGVHVRRFYYSEVLVNDPDEAEREFTAGLAAADKKTFNEIFSLVRDGMIDAMDLGSAQGEESRMIVKRELAWLDELLEDGRDYLIADRFSRADLAVAALTSPIVKPIESPLSSYYSLDNSEWNVHPCLSWAREIYRRHRGQEIVR